MTSFGQGNNQSKVVSQKQTNPFAGSLLENEKKALGNDSSQNDKEASSDSFANALLNSSGKTRDIDNQKLLRKQEA